jgi:tetratricopeptide (TPR) repeat protein
VLTGEAAVTLGAQGQGMVAGDLVNTASRIQSAATPGTVFVGEATRRATEASIVYEDAGSHEMKGKAEPVPLWRALRVVAGRGGALKSASLEAPFVGRDRELRLVKELFHTAAEEKRAHLLSVIGIGGIGKSRLAWEFEKYVDGLMELFPWHRGRCLAYGEGVTYWALAEMVRMRARIAESEDPSTAAPKLRAAIEQNVPDPEERDWIEPRLAHLLGLEERVARDAEDLFSAWRLFFERIAETGPTILVFEDMQWADPSLIDFVDYLMNWSKNHPIFVVVLTRPDFIDRHPAWGQSRRGATTLYLEPLSAEAMSELLSGLVPGLPDQLRASILDRAEGVPLYAVETVRMLLDRGMLVQEGSVYRPTGSVEHLEIPETLQALIAARLDGLDPAERRLIQDAAVLGKIFAKPAVEALGGLEEGEVENLLQSLIRKEFLSIQSDPRSPERGQYGFLQDLVRRVAYETLSRKDRKARHLAAAAYLESSWRSDEDEIAEVIASHYLEAYRAAPDAPDASEIKAKARGFLISAGKRAASLAAGAEAHRYFEQAIDLADDDDQRAELHERAGVMARVSGKTDRAVEHFESAMALFTSAGRTHPAARVSAAYAEVIRDLGRNDEAIERMDAAFKILQDEEHDADLATLAAQLGRYLLFNGRLDEAAARTELALELSEALQLPGLFSHALNTKALLLQSRGRPEEALVLLRHALKVAVDNDENDAALRAYNNLGAAMNPFRSSPGGVRLRRGSDRAVAEGREPAVGATRPRRTDPALVLPRTVGRGYGDRRRDHPLGRWGAPA